MSKATQSHITTSEQMEDTNPTGKSNPKTDTTDNSTTIIGGDAKTFHSLTPEERRDLDDRYDPDAYLIADGVKTASSITKLEYDLPGTNTIFSPHAKRKDGAENASIDNIDVVTCSNVGELAHVKRFEKHDIIDTDTVTVIITDALSLNVDQGSLKTTLDGLDEYKEFLKPDELDGEYIHITTRIQSGYRHEWDDLLIRGAGYADDSYSSDLTELTIHPDGTLATGTIDSDKLSIKAIQGVGATTAKRLREDGYDTVKSIADGNLSDLQQVKGLGKKRAKSVHDSAKAVAYGKIIPTTDVPVPASNPVYIDIETDGLNPTRVWLIGVKDSVSGNYMSFIETDHDDIGSAVEGFMMWYTANASNRTLLAWNGWNFDFPVLREHIQEHAPQYLEDWKRASKRDPLRWARDLDGGNAILPGRTNKLEDVADALGWRGHQTGLDGAEVARQYRKWMDEPKPENELDWEQHNQYCKDDVEALEFIFEEMTNASRTDASAVNHDRPTDENTDQGRLGEF